MCHVVFSINTEVRVAIALYEMSGSFNNSSGTDIFTNLTAIMLTLAKNRVILRILRVFQGA
jgi:hypothetical protein